MLVRGSYFFIKKKKLKKNRIIRTSYCWSFKEEAFEGFEYQSDKCWIQTNLSVH